MKKKLLIIVSALMMLFGSALTVSAEESDTDEPVETKYYINNEIKVYNVSDVSKYMHFTYVAELSTSTRVAAHIYQSDGSSQKWIRIYYLDSSTSKVYACFLPYTALEMLDENGYSSYEPFKIGDTSWMFLLDCEYPASNVHDGVNYAKTSTNIPYFSTYEEMENYLLTGDLTGNLNDGYDDMVDDDTFGLKGFQADNTITATWTGTTHDDVIDTYNKAKVGIRPGYAYKSAPGQIAVRSTVLQEYDIADKTFTKLYEELKPSDDTLFLRYLEVIPNYQKTALSTMYVGKSCWIWLNADGTVEKVVNDMDSGKPELNSEFYLLNVVCKDTLGDIAGDNISWTGTTHDAIITTLNLEDTEVQVYCSFTDYDGKNSFIDYHEISSGFYDNGKPLRLRSKIDDVSHGFQFYSKKAEEYGELYGKTFTGYVYMIPMYTKDSKTIKGLTTVVDVYNNDVRYVEEFDPTDPDTPVNPVDPTNPNPTNPSPDIPDIGDNFDIVDVFNYFISLLNWLKNNMGQVPSLLTSLFPMLPSQFSYLIMIGFVVTIILRIIGR